MATRGVLATPWAFEPSVLSHRQYVLTQPVTSFRKHCRHLEFDIEYPMGNYVPCRQIERRPGRSYSPGVGTQLQAGGGKR